MFCSNCGKQISDNTKFCNYCGAQQQITEKQQKIDDAPTQQRERIPKKKVNTIVVLAVVLCAFLLGKFVIAPSMVSDFDKENDTGNQGSQTQQATENSSELSTDSNNPAYEAIFADTYIVHYEMFFMMETANYAMKGDDGRIYCADYGYQDDVIKEYVEKVYIPISECTDVQKSDIENTMKSQFASIDSLNCCTVEHEMGLNYYTITCTYTDVDQASNYSELYYAGLLQENASPSMSRTEEMLLNQGFVKKQKRGIMMKKMIVALLVCLIACSLCGCTTKCHVYEECGKTIEKSSENKNPLGKGYLCEEHLEEASDIAKKAEEAGQTIEEYYDDLFN